jgi:hypothetical protein
MRPSPSLQAPDQGIGSKANPSNICAREYHPPVAEQGGAHRGHIIMLIMLDVQAVAQF